MFGDSSVAGSWPELVARLDEDGALKQWAGAEPALRGVASVAELPGAMKIAVQVGRADELLGPLVRLAAADGGDDPDAVLVLLHLLSDGVLTMAARLGDLADDIVALIVGELTAQIRTFPWRRRTRAYASSLLLDSKAALWRELRPARSRTFVHRREVLVDPLDAWQVGQLFDAPTTDGDGGPRLVEVLVWAQRRGVAPAEDLALLLELARVEDSQLKATQEEIAQRHRLSERTVRRRRDRTLAALREASGDYLRAVA